MIPELHACVEAEDYFAALGVTFDPAVLAVHRLPLLRRLGELLVEISDRHPGADEGTLRALARAGLQEAYHAARLGLTASRKPATSTCATCAIAAACGS